MKLDDPARLAALKRSGLFDKPPSERLRHIVYTAYVLLKADGAKMNIVSDAAQHTAAEWPRSMMSADIAPSDAGCSLVVQNDETLMLSDVRDHPVVCRMPWATTYRGYMGAPLHFDGQAVGSLCVLTLQPREWSYTDKMALEGLVLLASQSVEDV